MNGIRKIWVCLLVLGPALLLGDTLKFHNYSKGKVWVYIKKEGALGVDSSVKDYEKVVGPGESIEESGKNMPHMWALRFDAAAEKMDNDKRRDAAEKMGFKVHIGNTTRLLSFDVDAKGKPYLYEGLFPISTQKISFVALSDVHVGSDKEKDNAGILSLRSQMEKYINDASKSVKALIFVGDSAGGYGKESETKAFEKILYDPLKNLLRSKGGQVFLVPGNHDTYWSSVLEPKPTKMERLIKDNHGDYMYAFNIGPVKCINLGICPSLSKTQPSQGGKDKILDTDEPSLGFLKKVLQGIDKNQPVIIMFHYPVQGNMSDWWSKKEKDMLYDAIKDYNVLAILVGHLHAALVHSFRGKCPVVQAAGGNTFALLTYDASKPKSISIKFVDSRGIESSQTPITNAVEGDISTKK